MQVLHLQRCPQHRSSGNDDQGVYKQVFRDSSPLNAKRLRENHLYEQDLFTMLYPNSSVSPYETPGLMPPPAIQIL